jgi:hypothetical protein
MNADCRRADQRIGRTIGGAHVRRLHLCAICAGIVLFDGRLMTRRLCRPPFSIRFHSSSLFLFIRAHNIAAADFGACAVATVLSPHRLSRASPPASDSVCFAVALPVGSLPTCQMADAKASAAASAAVVTAVSANAKANANHLTIEGLRRPSSSALRLHVFASDLSCFVCVMPVHCHSQIAVADRAHGGRRDSGRCIGRGCARGRHSHSASRHTAIRSAAEGSQCRGCGRRRRRRSQSVIGGCGCRCGCLCRCCSCRCGGQ